MIQAFDTDDVLENGITEVDSLCMNCQETGHSRFLYTRIPHFRDILVCHFECPHCGFSSNEVQPAEELADHALKYTLKINLENAKEDLNRQVIKSNHGSIFIPELDFEIPSMTQRGEINTIEGFLTTAASKLQEGQEIRREMDSVTADAIQQVIDKLVLMSQGFEEFTFILDDLSGNSFLENLNAPHNDPRAVITRYNRTEEQCRAMGYMTSADIPQQPSETAAQMDPSLKKSGFSVSEEIRSKLDTYFDVTKQSANFPGVCPSCHRPCEIRMCITEIPYFKEVILMVSECVMCGFKDAEVKPGGAISSLGKKITLRITSPEDLKRDLLKSDSAAIYIPELELEMMHGTLGGKYSTIEGILDDIYNQLSESSAFTSGDSANPEDKQNFEEWVHRFLELKKCETPFTLILDDPLGNIFIYNPHQPASDPQMTIEEYERTEEMNEELGISDMNTDPWDQPSS